MEHEPLSKQKIKTYYECMISIVDLIYNLGHTCFWNEVPVSKLIELTSNSEFKLLN